MIGIPRDTETDAHILEVAAKVRAYLFLLPLFSEIINHILHISLQQKFMANVLHIQADCAQCLVTFSSDLVM